MEFNNIYQEKLELEKQKGKFLEKTKSIRRMFYILIITSLLIFIGAANMYSTLFIIEKADAISYVKHVGIAVIVASIIYGIDYRKWNNRKFLRICILLSIISLLSIRLLHPYYESVFKKNNGAYAWIKIPGRNFQIQPSELIKIIFIFYMAFSLSITEKKKIMNPGKIFLFNAIVPSMIVGAVIYQKDLGTALHYIAIFLFLIFLSKIDIVYFKYFTSAILLFASVSFYMICNLDLKDASGHMLPRIQSWLIGLFTGKYEGDIGYQVGQGLIALGNGGFLGKGYGHGVFKYNYVPEIHTDFIISSFGEEFGIVGLVILVLLFYALFNQMMATAQSSLDYFGRYLSAGIAAMIFSQFLINICVVLGLLPVFGIPLPLLSYGGTSLMTVIISVALVLGVNKQVKNRR